MTHTIVHNSRPTVTAFQSLAPIPHDPRQTAQYIADMVLELRNMSKSEGFGTLQGLLELAYYEAFTVAHKVEMPPGEQEYLESLAQDVKRETE